MDADSPKMTYGQQVAAALNAAMALPRPRPRPDPEFVAFINSLEATLIDPRCFEARLEYEVSDHLKRIEEDSAE